MASSYIVFSAWATKEGSAFPKTWKRRFFCLSEQSVLSYFKSDQQLDSQKPLGSFSIVDEPVQQSEAKGKPHTFKIGRGGKSMYIQTDNQESLDRWLRVLEENGALLLKDKETQLARASGAFSQIAAEALSLQLREQSQKIDLDMTNTMVKDWTLEHVRIWLKSVLLSPGETAFSRYEQCFVSSNTVGTILSQLADTEAMDLKFQEIGVASPDDRALLAESLSDALGMSPGPGPAVMIQHRYAILEKLKNNVIWSPSSSEASDDVTMLRMRLEALGNAALLRQIFLSTEPWDDDTMKSLAEQEHGSSLQCDFTGYRMQSRPIKVRLVIAEMPLAAESGASEKRTIRELLSPVYAWPNRTSKQQKLGLCHVALAVGPWYLEWNDSTLCVPKRLTASMAAQLPTCWTCDLNVEESIDNVADKLSTVVAEFNVTKKYKAFHKQQLGTDYCNGWSFVETVLNALGSAQPPIEDGGALGNFIVAVGARGRSSLSFVPSRELARTTKLTKASFTFEAHKEFDTFVSSMLQSYSKLKTDYSSEYLVLDAFDRVFQFKDMVQGVSTAFRHRCDGEGATSCPFLNEL